MINYCLGFAKYKDFYILIHKTHPEFQKGKLNGVGGHVEKNESIIDSMVREFYEEANCATYEENWISRGTIKGSDFLVNVFSIDLNYDQYTDILQQNPLVGLDEFLNSSSEKEDIVIIHFDQINQAKNENKLVEFVYEIITIKGNKQYTAREQYESIGL
jgi:8-oxo-dGTP pyrophosphatase MutT (NUDIX family)